MNRGGICGDWRELDPTDQADMGVFLGERLVVHDEASSSETLRILLNDHCVVFFPLTPRVCIDFNQLAWKPCVQTTALIVCIVDHPLKSSLAHLTKCKLTERLFPFFFSSVSVSRSRSLAREGSL